MNSTKSKLILLAGMSMCLASLTSHATVIFHNYGTTAIGGTGGWSSYNLDSPGTISQSTSQVYKGTTSIKSQVVYQGTGYTGRYHAMCRLDNVYQPGDTGFYGFAFYLRSSWEFDNQQYQLFQFIADFTDSGCDTWMPSTMVWVQGNQLNTRRKYGTACDQLITEYNNVATVSAGVWHTIEIQALWEPDDTGYIKLWFDESKVVQEFNCKTTLTDGENRFYDMDTGLYANSWHDDGYMLGSQGTRYAYFDEIGWGTAYADADPAQW
jgi:hypothetical protein